MYDTENILNMFTVFYYKCPRQGMGVGGDSYVLGFQQLFDPYMKGM